jgi:transcriptional regulator with XRE-family HTH domain
MRRTSFPLWTFPSEFGNLEFDGPSIKRRQSAGSLILAACVLFEEAPAMATVDSDSFMNSELSIDGGTSAGRDSRPRYHRVRIVRNQQGVSLRSVARQTGKDVRSLRQEEEESSDLTISELQQWQKALGVPIAELVEEADGCLSRPVLERARLVRLMKTAGAIVEQSKESGIQRMAQMLVQQLIEVMPELEHISPWHQFGQRRGLEEYGRVVERRLSDDSLMRSIDD